MRDTRDVGEQAEWDQVHAVHRDFAAFCRGLTDECIKMGYNRDEAFDLTLRYLDRTCQCDS